MHPYELTISQATEKLSQKELSSRELTLSCLERIAAIDGHIKAFISVNYDQALPRLIRLIRQGVMREGSCVVSLFQ